jgi:hypothetical protein
VKSAHSRDRVLVVDQREAVGHERVKLERKGAVADARRAVRVDRRARRELRELGDERVRGERRERAAERVASDEEARRRRARGRGGRECLARGREHRRVDGLEGGEEAAVHADGDPEQAEAKGRGERGHARWRVGRFKK